MAVQGHCQECPIMYDICVWYTVNKTVTAHLLQLPSAMCDQWEAQEVRSRDLL